MGRVQRKAMEAAQKVLGDEATVVDQANTFAGPNPTMVAIGLAGGLLLVFSLTRILLGGLLVIAIFNVIRQPRNLVLTNRGLALFKSSFVMARPSELIGTYATADLTTNAGPAQLGWVPVQVHPERVWIRPRDRDRFLGAA